MNVLRINQASLSTSFYYNPIKITMKRYARKRSLSAQNHEETPITPFPQKKTCPKPFIHISILLPMQFFIFYVSVFYAQLQSFKRLRVA